MQQKAFSPSLTAAQAVGLSLYQVHEGEWQATAVWLSRKGHKVEMKGHWEGVWPSEKFPPAFPKHLPIALVLDGKGILHKPLPGSSVEASPGQLLKQVMPGASLDDFCVQQTKGAEHVYLSLLRYQLLDEVFSSLEGAGHSVTTLSFGPFAGAHLAGSLLTTQQGSEPTKVSIHGKSIAVRAGKVLSLSPPGEAEPVHSFSIGEETVPATLLSAYCMALEGLLDYGLAPRADSARVAKASEAWKGNQRLKRTATAILCAFFAVLLVNFFAFSYYTGELAALEQQAALLDPARKQTQKLVVELTQKEAFLRQRGWLSVSKASYYADRLAATVPKGIRLREISVYPVDEKRSREEKRTVINPHVLLVRGVCNEPRILDQWLSTVSSLEWAQQLSPPDYRFGEREGRGQFSIQIYLQPSQ